MEKTLSVLLFLFILTLNGCAGEEEAETVEIEVEEVEEVASSSELFFDNLAALCGETFVGEAVYPDDPDHELVDVELIANVETCTESEIRVPFIAGEDESRTWVFTKTDDGIHLRHDHRYPDGTPHDLTDYGGFASEEGTEWVQYFEADDLTAELIPEAVTNVWMVEIDAENGELVYYLERHAEPRFRAELSKSE